MHNTKEGIHFMISANDRERMRAATFDWKCVKLSIPNWWNEFTTYEWHVWEHWAMIVHICVCWAPPRWVCSSQMLRFCWRFRYRWSWLNIIESLKASSSSLTVWRRDFHNVLSFIFQLKSQFNCLEIPKR